VAVKTLTQITPQLGYEYLLKFGFTTIHQAKEVNGEIYSDIHQSLALGGITDGVLNIELNAAYATIANMGIYHKPKLYTKVVDLQGNVILDNTAGETRQVLRETTAFLLTSAMQDVVTKGTGTAVNFGGMPIAGKTGTTSDDIDVWFAGYTPYYTTTVWTGYDNNARLRTSAERNLSKTLWRLVMSQIHEELPSASFITPPGLYQATVCSKSGKLPIPGICDHTLRTEYFTEETIPSESCNVHYQGTLCSYSQLPASETCPFKAEGIFELIPPEHPALLSGSNTLSSGGAGTPQTGVTQTPEGAVVGSEGGTADPNTPTTPAISYCPHTPAFMADPNNAPVVAQQQAELQQAAIAAAAAAQTQDQNPPQ